MKQVFPAVKAVILNKGKFLIIKQNINQSWDLPGGKIEHGETPKETLFREVKEETCLDIEIVECLGMWWFFRTVDGNQVVCTTFLCSPKTDNVDISKNPTSEGIEEFKWVTKDEFLGDGYTPVHQSLKDLVSKSLRE
ncbi:MAG: NUDIX hydrolase [Patescibacteria group bacterium]